MKRPLRRASLARLRVSIKMNLGSGFRVRGCGPDRPEPGAPNPERERPAVIVIGALSFTALLTSCAASAKFMAVNIPVSDLRAQPKTTAQPAVHDPAEETQLVYGERVRVLAVKDGWAQVEAIEQSEMTHAGRWQGYPGWLPASTLLPWDPLEAPNVVVVEKWTDVWRDAYTQDKLSWRFPLGTRLRATDIGGVLWRVELLDGTQVWLQHRAACSLPKLRAQPPSEQRRAILRNAQLMIGDAYYWGGRSPQSPERTSAVTGVDCSGLVNLAYRAAGLDIPRDAHEQFLRAHAAKTLQPADLIFLSERGNPKRIVHVMLYAGDGQLIEGPGTGAAVRRIALAQRLGQPLDRLAPGSVVDGQTVFFGSYLD